MLQFAVELSTKRRLHKLHMQLLPILLTSLVLSSLVDFNLNVMEKVNLQYSMKNIPIPSKHEYKKMLVAKTEHLIKRMRWKVLAFDGKLKSSNKNTYGFRTSLYPEPSPDLVQFESDLMDMIRNIEFRPVHNDFQARMREDITNIKNSNKVYVSADKSTNLYKMEKTDYESHLVNNITSTYKKSSQDQVDRINRGALECAKKLDLEDRMEKLQTTEAYITVKDHKEDFNVKPSFRLINPSKTDIGRVSKQLLDGINQELLRGTHVNQWKNTNSVVDWFKQIRGKRRCTFMQFDIENFYPSISPALFDKAINFAKQYVDIPDLHMDIIKQARSTLLFHQGEPWCKQTGDGSFDVPMGSYDGAEVCELVGIYLLSQITDVVDNADVGLYRDDGLAVMRNIGKPEVERRKKRIIKIFKDNGLSITIKAHLQVVQYLDVEFSLRDGLYRPYRKPSSNPLYINRYSNHPPSVIKQVPDSIAHRLSDISSSAEVFQQALPEYQNALRDSGFDTMLSYSVTNSTQQQSKRNRKRKIIWYNPPYSASVKTNVGKKFLALIRTHFHRNHRLYPIFNIKSVKVSYCCMRNISSIISGHNKFVLSKDNVQPNARMCNCRQRNDCPLNGLCLTSNIIYGGDVVNLTDNQLRPYVGLTSDTFKERMGVHNQGINHRVYSKSCELTKHVWQLRDSGKAFSVRWKILEHVKGRLIGGECRLCVTEKLHIIEHPSYRDGLLNSNSDMKCVHGWKHKLLSIGNTGRGRSRKRVKRVTGVT